jgi:hypothetical protein
LLLATCAGEAAKGDKDSGFMVEFEAAKLQGTAETIRARNRSVQNTINR